MLNVNLFNGLAFGDLRVSYHLVGGADLDEGELGIFSNLCSQRCFPTVRWTWGRPSITNQLFVINKQSCSTSRGFTVSHMLTVWLCGINLCEAYPLGAQTPVACSRCSSSAEQEAPHPSGQQTPRHPIGLSRSWCSWHSPPDWYQTPGQEDMWGHSWVVVLFRWGIIMGLVFPWGRAMEVRNDQQNNKCNTTNARQYGLKIQKVHIQRIKSLVVVSICFVFGIICYNVIVIICLNVVH